MYVYQTNDDGVFVGIIIADESPMEPGVFLIPAGCIIEEPPSFEKGSLARWIEGSWQIEDVPEVVPEPEPPVVEMPSLGVSRAQALMALYNAGLLTQVRDVVAAHPYEPVRIWFDNATNWHRENPYVLALSMELGLSETQVDELFISARLLTE